jgi:hypothetical protein
MDFFQSQTVPKPFAFFHIPERSIALVKRLAGSPKGWNWSHLPLTSVTQGSTILIHWWTSFSRTKLWPSRCYLTFFHFPNVQLLVKRLAGSPKELKLIHLPTLTKCYSRCTRILIYIDGLLSVQTVPKPLLSYLLPFSRTFNCTSKTTGWFTKRSWNWSPYANKVLLKVAHSYIHWWTSFSRTKLWPSLLSYLLPYSHRTVNFLAGSPKGWNDPNLPHANKVLLQVARILIYIDGLLSVAPNCAQAVAILPSSIFPNVQLH